MGEPNKDQEYGEGNYKASRQYNEATKQFVDSGKVEKAAREAAPRTPEEAKDMKRAEEAGRKRAKEEDPALAPKEGPDAVDESAPTPKPGQDAR